MRGVARSECESSSSGVDWYLSAWQSRAWQTLTNLRGMTLPWTQVCGIWRRRSEVARVSVGGGYDAGRTPEKYSNAAALPLSVPTIIDLSSSGTT